MLVELHRCHDIQTALKAAVIIEMNITYNQLHQLLSAGEFAAIVALSLEDAPKALHGAVVKTMGNARHTLFHLGFLDLLVEYGTGVLEPPVAVEERVGFRLGSYGGIKGIENELVVIVVAHGVGDNSPVVQVKNCAKVNLVNHGANVVFELSYVGQPLHVRSLCMEIAVQVVLCHMGR